ncbi:MAG: proton-conducting transporter membrane subunit, partial [Acidimicrobiales bacterium]
MTDFLNTWGITAMVFIPLLGAAIMLVVPGRDEELHKLIALVASLAAAVVGLELLINFDYDDTRALQFAVDHRWIDVINARYSVALDGMSLPLVALTLLVVPLVIIYSWNHIPDPGNAKAFLILILILHTGMLGTFVAQDLVLFFVFFEVVLLPMYFMIGVWGGEQRLYAAIKFFLYTLFGSALMLVSFLALYWVTGSDTFSMTGLAQGVIEHDVPLTTQVLIFGGM